MRKLGFWTDNEREQTAAINEAAEELGQVQSSTNFLHQRVDSLQRLVSAQQVEIGQLKAALQAVCDALVDLDLIEEQALAYRIEAALADAAAASAAASVAEPPPPRPFDAQTPAPAPRRTTADCSHCHRSVPVGDISFTDRGPMCDACIGALAAQSPE